jgi:hypothetical protein
MSRRRLPDRLLRAETAACKHSAESRKAKRKVPTFHHNPSEGNALEDIIMTLQSNYAKPKSTAKSGCVTVRRGRLCVCNAAKNPEICSD